MNNFCGNCGTKIYENDVVCSRCGVKLKNNNYNISNQVSNTNDDGGIGWSFLGFFVPLVGLILFLAWNKEKPKTAKAVGKGALISVIVNIVVTVFFVILVFGIINNYEYNNDFDIYDDYDYDDYMYKFE